MYILIYVSIYLLHYICYTLLSPKHTYNIPLYLITPTSYYVLSTFINSYSYTLYTNQLTCYPILPPFILFLLLLPCIPPFIHIPITKQYIKR